LKNGPKQPKNILFYAVLGYLGTPKWIKKVHKGLQVDGMYDPMSQLENKPHAKSIGPFLLEKWSKKTEKSFF
jgi:hypothetical protein